MSGSCIFHDDKHYLDHKPELLARLSEKVKESTINQKELDCTDYHIPDIEIKELFKVLVSFRGATFHGKADFSRSIFYEEVDFSEAKFTDIVDFSGVRFSGKGNFFKATFHKKASFTGSSFDDKVEFFETNFCDNADFSDASFNSEANFSHSNFDSRAIFSSAIFKSKGVFQETIFTNGANFVSCIFNDEANFSNVIFKETVDFIWPRFQKEVRFNGAKFGKEANFSHFEFSSLADFGNTRFSDRADFSYTIFHENSLPLFYNANFENNVNFSGANFRNDVQFSFANFRNDADFAGAIFNKKADFSFTKFRQSRFTSTKFFQDAYFAGTNFQEANFVGTEFSCKALFNGARFQEASFHGIMFRDEADFSLVIFENQDKVLFIVPDMSNVSFINTDITGIRFAENVFWGKKERDNFKVIDEEKIELSFRFLFSWENLCKDNAAIETLKDFLKQNYISPIENIHCQRIDEDTISISNPLSIILSPEDRNKVIIEINQWTYVPLNSISLFIKMSKDKTSATLLSGSNRMYEFIVKKENNCLTLYPQPVNLREVITVYRNLRENYEHYLRYEVADKFFVNEMELKRKYREKIVQNIYTVKRNCWFRRNLSLTGLYHWVSEYGQNYKRPALLAIFIISLPILYSLLHQSLSSEGLTLQNVSNITQQNFRNILPIEEDKDIVGYFIGIATIPILGGLLIAALKRTFEKRFRH